MGSVRVREVGLRDGLQSLNGFIPTNIKKKLCRTYAAAGLRDFEVTSFVPRGVLAQFSDAEQMVQYINSQQDLRSSVLVPNLKGVRNAVEAEARQLMYVLSASDEHNQSNLRRTTEQSIQQLRDVVAFLNELEEERRPRLLVGISTAFGCSLQGQVLQSTVLKIAEQLLTLGVNEISLADTVGYGNPKEVADMFKELVAMADCDVAAHFHDTRGLGLANVHAALNAGVTIFDSSFGGIGGCPFAPGASGNIATEDLVWMLNSMGLQTGVNLGALLEARLTLSELLPNVRFHDRISTAGLASKTVQLGHQRACA